jgi:hypothetical protein
MSAIYLVHTYLNQIACIPLIPFISASWLVCTYLKQDHTHSPETPNRFRFSDAPGIKLLLKAALPVYPTYDVIRSARRDVEMRHHPQKRVVQRGGNLSFATKKGSENVKQIDMPKEMVSADTMFRSQKA